MNINEIVEELGASWDGYKKSMQEALANNNPLLTNINSYLLNNGGKQLRPILSLLAASACGAVTSKNHYCAAVSEMVHTATLLHDDVADNGNIRRGVPTVRAVFGNSASVLTGDYWLSQALKTLCEKCNTDVLGCFTIALGELSGGELLQMEKASKLNTTKADYYEIIRCKTSSLFIAAMKSAVLCNNSDKKYVEAIEKYAYHLGLAFQIRDDIFDYSPKMNTGKNAGADIKERKITLPLLCALEKAPENLSREIISAIAKIDFANTQKEEDININISNTVTKFVLEHNGVELAQGELNSHISLALQALSILPDSNSKEKLCQIAEYLKVRNN